ncbi:MAG: hypothetical protein PHP85_03055 [Gallionella sp.]|nr:hypothetical protein [Gallionella sp.]
MIEAERLNADSQAGRLNSMDLQQALGAQGDAWQRLVSERCPHLFAEVAVFVSPAQLQQMKELIAATERVVNSSEWQVASSKLGGGEQGAENGQLKTGPSGVFYGYDFHLNSDGAQLIEINTNAGGGFLNALLSGSQVSLPGDAVSEFDLEQVFVDMFRREWQRARGDAPLNCIAIVDQLPEEQYLYPEFLLAKSMFERAGIRTFISDPAQLEVRDDGLYVAGTRTDMIYNRLTDFDLQQYPALLGAWHADNVVLTPDPAHYARYADKRNLARLTDVDELRALGIAEADIRTLQSAIPHTFVVRPELEDALWSTRKQLFFKPYRGYGSRGAYRGEKLTRRVFGEILQSGYVAQRLSPPSERCVDEGVTLKYDLRCYVYDGQIQLAAARLYQGQTTNFRTPGGGFSPVRVAG